MSQKNDILNNFTRFLLNIKNGFASIVHTHTVSDITDLSDFDVKVTNTLDTNAKAYITGTTSNETNTGTQIFDTGIYIDFTEGRLVSDSVMVNSILVGNATGNATITYDAENQRMVFSVAEVN